MTEFPNNSEISSINDLSNNLGANMDITHPYEVFPMNFPFLGNSDVITLEEDDNFSKIIESDTNITRNLEEKFKIKSDKQIKINKYNLNKEDNFLKEKKNSNCSNNVNSLKSFNNMKENESNTIISINNNNNLIRKKRIFDIKYPNYFFIFTKSDNNNDIRKIIEESLKKDKKSSKIKIIKRRDNADIIRKKIKAKFFKSLRNRSNEKLKIGGSLKFFNLLPQKFISNLSKKINKEAFDLTFEKIFSKNFCEPGEYKNIDDPNLKKYKENLSVIEYLNKRREICEKSEYNIFKNKQLYQIYDEYLRSKEFEDDILALKQQKEKTDYFKNDKYIKSYVKLAFNMKNFIYH